MVDLPTKVTSIRINADLLDKATAFGINISKFCEVALSKELNRLTLNLGIVPEGTMGISKHSRIIMAGEKFKNITKIRVGDRVLSYNELTGRVEEANVIDVGLLTQEDAFVTPITIENNGGTKIQILPGTKIFCRQRNLSNNDWLTARDIQRDFLIPMISHKSHFFGSTLIGRVSKEYARGSFFRLEVYPNNSFFANSNLRRKTHYIEDYGASVWAFLVKGYLGQIGCLLEQGRQTPNSQD